MIQRITANGLQPTESATIRPGRVHKMGYSSSPKRVFVVNMSDKRVTYVPLSGSSNPDSFRFYTEDRVIFEDLVAEANATLRKDAARQRKQWPGEYGEQVAQVQSLQYIEGRLPTEKEKSRIEIALS